MIIAKIMTQDLLKLTRRARLFPQTLKITQQIHTSRPRIQRIQKILVLSVRRQSELAYSMHCACSNLDLDRLLADTAKRKDHSMDRPVPVLFRRTDVVFEFAGNGVHDAMHDGKSLIAIHRILHDDTKRQTIRELLESSILEDHFTVGGIVPLDAEPHYALQTVFSHFPAKKGSDMPKAGPVKGPVCGEFAFQTPGNARMQKPEANILHFRTPCVHSQPPRNSGIHVKCLMGDTTTQRNGKNPQVTHVIETMHHSQKNQALICGESGKERIQIFRILIDMQSAQVMHPERQPLFRRGKRRLSQQNIPIRMKRDIVKQSHG